MKTSQQSIDYNSQCSLPISSGLVREDLAKTHWTTWLDWTGLILTLTKPLLHHVNTNRSGRTDLDLDRTSSSFWTVLRPSRRNIADTKFSGKLRAEETSFFTNVELLHRRASKNVMLPKRPPEQSKKSSNYGRATYSTHSSLGINSSTTSFFEICRSIFTARGLTTKLMFDQSSLFFESCQVLCDQNSTFLLILRLPNARLQIMIFALSTILSRRAGYHILPPPLNRIRPRILVA